MRLACWLGLALVACGSSSDPAPSRESGSAAPQASAPRLRLLARYPGAMLVAGARTIALLDGDSWVQPTRTGTLAKSPLGSRITKLRAEVGGDFEVFLGADPIIIAGEEHHERVVRVTADGARDLELDDRHVVGVVAVEGGEVWLVEEKLRAQLALVRGATIDVREPFALIAPPEPGLSPVSARKCATAQIKDLAGNGRLAAALVVECNPAAPVRIYRERGDGTPTLTQHTDLGLVPSQIAVGRDGAIVIAGIAAGKLAIARTAPVRAQTTTIAATVVVQAVVADDGALWALTIAGAARPVVSRDGVEISLLDPDGHNPMPQRMAVDADLGVVVFADGLLYVER